MHRVPWPEDRGCGAPAGDRGLVHVGSHGRVRIRIHFRAGVDLFRMRDPQRFRRLAMRGVPHFPRVERQVRTLSANGSHPPAAGQEGGDLPATAAHDGGVEGY